jgi:hypothetical protein
MIRKFSAFQNLQDQCGFTDLPRTGQNLNETTRLIQSSR